jgi:ribonuclease HII
MGYVRLPLTKRPSIRVEKDFATKCGGAWVAGVDEAGRGPIAGPVVAAAVILPFAGRRPVGLRDSKQMSLAARERLFDAIRRLAVSHGIGIATAQEIDTLNILEATRLAARRALAQLDPPAGALVTDALELPGDTRPTLPVVKGDAICASVAAASILAKVTRDRMMDAYHTQFPEYGWDRNRGYPTEDHYAAITAHGPTVLHRLSFAGVGFFDPHLRRSPLFDAVMSRVDAAGGLDDSLRAQLRETLAAEADRLPPPDVAELRQLLDSPATR